MDGGKLRGHSYMQLLRVAVHKEMSLPQWTFVGPTACHGTFQAGAKMWALKAGLGLI